MNLSKSFTLEQIQGYESLIEDYNKVIKEIKGNLRKSTGKKKEAFGKLLKLAKSEQEICREQLKRCLEGNM